MIGSILNLVEGASNIIEKLEEILECTKNIVQKTDSIQQQTDSVQYQVTDTLQLNLQKQVTLNNDYSLFDKFYQFSAKCDGFIRARILISSKDYVGIAYIMRSLHDYYSNSGSQTAKNYSMTPVSLYTAPVDSTITDFQLQTRNTGSDIFGLLSNNFIQGTNYSSRNNVVTNGLTVLDTVFPVKKGEQVVFLISKRANATFTLELYYDEVRV